ncbi:Tubulin-specific chaperone E [Hondaea fermentalgiana]|uniref:Tubulin-specific chaperone E n=1 Tax=Hondaea fermentalgiana TaxID=2315210 RepID=A0A2R5H1J9_9STRA|nr:Tubulin-specific chaperone E [Hondaea fermentalgiana]|eukprot:GBG34224.1 Tubulin-specific chaperone E [Hondaea fermentalgiana]
MAANRFEVGDVVVDEEGYRGSVRYVGPVATAKKKDATWIGVEWADAGRGKHDGSVKEKTTGEETRYFSCPQGQGSFVKPQFLRVGVAFEDALMARYEPEAAVRVGEGVEGEAGPRRRNGEAVEIEAVGMDQIRGKQQIHKLREVSLSSCVVVSAGQPGWISEHCPHIKELDLADNLIDSWKTVGLIASQLPGLEHLSLARNRLATGLPINPIEPLPAPLKIPFAALRVLVLNRTGTTFSQVQRLDEEGVIPALEELVLGDNDLDTLDPLANVKSDTVSHQRGSYAEWAKEQIKLADRSGFTPESFAKGFASLRKIDISRNKLATWSEVWRLSRLPALRHINVSDNPIDEIFFDLPAMAALADPADAPQPSGPAVEAGDGASARRNPGKENEMQQSRLKAAEAFRRKLDGLETNQTEDADQEQSCCGADAEGDCAADTNETDSPSSPNDGGEAEHKADEDADTKKKPSRFVNELDIVMSNGMVIPMQEKRERARYTEARLFKGSGTQGGSQPFRSLETLLLCRTRITSWTSVDALNKFPAIKEARLQGSPLIAAAGNAGAARQTVIARVKGFVRLNGSEVSPRERSDAERLYLKRVAAALTSLSGPERDAKLAEHPRYDELVAEHGDPTEAARRAKAAQEADGSLASNSAKVTISSFDPRTCTAPPVTKRLLLSMSVKELKLLCQRLFKVDVDLQKLFYREKSKDFGHPVALDEDGMAIVDFGVKAGGEIIMEARDPEKEKADADKRAAQESQRMKDQETRAAREAAIKREEIERQKQSLLSSSTD